MDTNQVEVPPVEMVDVDLLKIDGDNPNRMTEKQREALRESLRRWGFIVPIISNKDYIIADGQQRYEEARDTFHLKQVPVVRLPVSDVDRRLLRQVLNKLRGEHEALGDAEEFQKILEADRREDLELFLGLQEKDLASYQKLIDERNKQQREIVTKGITEDNEKDFVMCPRYLFEFDPRFFRVVSPIRDPEEQVQIEEGTDRGLGKRNNVVLNLSFATTTPEVNQRVIAVAEAFGVGIDETVKFEVYDKVELSYDDSDIIYVSGDSGSGKSTLLRLIGDYEGKRGRNVVNLGDVQPSPDEVLIDGLGADIDEGMELLSLAGLSEAFLMLRKYGELSDGQKYRYRLAKLMAQAPEVR